MKLPQTFSMRGAKPTTLLVGVAMATVVEGIALHLLLAPLHPRLAYSLEALGVATFLWLWRVFGSVAAGTVSVSDDVIEIVAGRVAAVRIDRALVASVVRASWKDLPQKGTADAVGYVNLTAPTEPAVVLHLRGQVSVRQLGLATRSATRLALWVDDEAAFRQSLHRADAP